jgi:hypothetical protein
MLATVASDQKKQQADAVSTAMQDSAAGRRRSCLSPKAGARIGGCDTPAADEDQV